PVTFPPGRLRLATRPAAAGSKPTTKTIGMVVVATLAERAAGGACGRATNSAAMAGKRSYCPPSQRNSIAIFFTFRKVHFTQATPKGAYLRACLVLGRGAEKPDDRHCLLLGASCTWP